MATKQVSDDSFETDVLNSGQPVLVDFWAEWCGPCKTIAPALDEIATEMSGQLTVAKVNIDDHPMTPGKYGVRAIPTVLAFKGGTVVEQVTGARPKSVFVDMAQKLI